MRARLTVYGDRVRRYASREGSFDERKQIAEKIVQDARPLAPVVSYDYRGGIGVKVEGNSVMVVDDDENAIHKEYGTSDTPAHAALTTAAMGYGRYSGTRPKKGRMK